MGFARGRKWLQTFRLDNAKPTKKVAWSQVEIRVFQVILGDSPSVSSGPPIMLGWDVLDTYCLNLETFEKEHAPRRNSKELTVSAL